MRYSSWIHREVSEKDAKDYADSIHAIFVETSAKNAININEVFIEISESVSWTFGTFGFLFASVFTKWHSFQISFNIYATLQKKKLTMAESLVMWGKWGQGCIYSVTKRIFPELAFHRLPFAAKAAVTH